MARTTTVIIGAGQAGLAMSRCLSESGIEHVVLERGQVAERWRSHSWDSLHLLTPNWMTRLPGFHYDGDDPDGFMSARELIAFFERYAAASAAPILSNTTVQRVERSGDEFRVVSDRGVWTSASVVRGDRLLRSARDSRGEPWSRGAHSTAGGLGVPASRRSA